MMGLLEEKMNRELVRYAVGRAIFCPSCDRVLDIADAVLMTTKNDGPCAVTCGACHDELRARLTAVEDAALLTRVDIIDTRVKS
jgi:hypothetical protein